MRKVRARDEEHGTSRLFDRALDRMDRYSDRGTRLITHQHGRNGNVRKKTLQERVLHLQTVLVEMDFGRETDAGRCALERRDEVPVDLNDAERGLDTPSLNQKKAVAPLMARPEQHHAVETLTLQKTIGRGGDAPRISNPRMRHHERT